MGDVSLIYGWDMEMAKEKETEIEMGRGRWKREIVDVKIGGLAM